MGAGRRGRDARRSHASCVMFGNGCSCLRRAPVASSPRGESDLAHCDDAGRFWGLAWPRTRHPCARVRADATSRHRAPSTEQTQQKDLRVESLSRTQNTSAPETLEHVNWRRRVSPRASPSEWQQREASRSSTLAHTPSRRSEAGRVRACAHGVDARLVRGAARRALAGWLAYLADLARVFAAAVRVRI